MNEIFVTNISVNQDGIVGTFDVIGSNEWINCFRKPYQFYIEYSEDISQTPESIAILPFVANILPTVWLFDAKLFVKELDLDFYESIKYFKRGYENMYSSLNFKGELCVEKLKKNVYEKKNTGVLFSGGVDAFHTLLTHISENPILITLWGADVSMKNNNGWKPVNEQLELVSKLLNLKYFIVKTNFREYINEPFMDKWLKKQSLNLGWWHDFQHGLGIISHSAPLSYVLGIETVYIASSFTKNDIGNYTCASDPTIDNYVRFGNTKIIHDGYEHNRQMKIHNICNIKNIKNINLPLRVCWESKDGKNCCSCEKCYRTILAIIVEGENPIKYGFERFDENTRKKMMKELKYKFFIKYYFNRYKPIQNKLQSVYSYDDCPADLKWLYKLQFKKKMPAYVYIYYKMKRKLTIFYLYKKKIDWYGKI